MSELKKDIECQSCKTVFRVIIWAKTNAIRPYCPLCGCVTTKEIGQSKPIDDKLMDEIEELRSTVCLFNSMILSGEKHTSISLAMLESALKTKVKVCKKEGE